MISSDIALIGTTIHRVAQLIQQRIDQDIRDSGLTRLSWMAAAHVEDAPGLTIGDLADRLEVGPATAGQLVDRMVRGGWVERWASPDDRRGQARAAGADRASDDPLPVTTPTDAGHGVAWNTAHAAAAANRGQPWPLAWVSACWHQRTVRPPAQPS